ncbi:Uncharacterised protein [Bordetella pertussis]|nr:Uncharacterised protein [Bordetella pertussis]
MSSCNSGITRASAPARASTSSMRDGACAINPRDTSFQTRSGTSASASPASTMRRHSCMVSGAMLKSPKRAAKRPRRRMRTGSSAKASPTWRSTRARTSATPSSGSTSSPCGVRAIALTVRSRRCRSCSSVTSAPV